MKILVNFLLLLVLCFSSCMDKNTDVQNKTQDVDKEDFKKTLEKANRYMILQELEQINDYIERHNLNVIETGTGLRYQILKNGDSELIKKGDIVTLEYEMYFLTGDLVYSSKNDGKKTFLVGKGGVESGLEEAILKLHKNDIAVLILPSHLAYGLLGDGNKIPARATLVYRVKVVDNQSIDTNEVN